MRSSVEDGKKASYVRWNFPPASWQTLSYFPSGWHLVWDGFSCKANHTSVSCSPWWWGHLQTAERGDLQHRNKAHGDSFTSLSSHHGKICSNVVWKSETFSHLSFWLCSTGGIFISHLNYSPFSTLCFSSQRSSFQMVLSFILSSLNDPSSLWLSSDGTPHSSYSLKERSFYHHYDLRDDRVCLTKSTHKSHLPAALQLWA